MNRKIKRWSAPGGYAAVLKIAFPLILSTGSHSILQFVDRMFLSWYSPESIAAAMPAGLLSFTLMCLFVGTGSYVSTFVAQYYGAGRDNEIGSAIWQSIYFSIIAAVIILAFVPLADTIFTIGGHPEPVRKLEVAYFKIMCFSAFFSVASSSLSGFFSGIGRTFVIMWVHLTGTGINIILDYCMIFGKFGFPEWGIVGAGIATNISLLCSLIILVILIFRPENLERFGLWKNKKFNPELFRRLLRFGFPAGIQSFLDMLAFSFFLFLVGRLGMIELAANNIVFNISTLAFMPMTGLGIAVSILVGQNLGRNDPETAGFTAWSGTHISFSYMFLISACYVLFPDIFLKPFGFQSDSATFSQIRDYGVVLLRFIALYSLFDSLNIIFSSALKGAGDTRFVMIVTVSMSWLIMVLPSFLAIVVFKAHLFTAWGFMILFVALLSCAFLRRFIQGKWQNMRVIDNVNIKELS